MKSAIFKKAGTIAVEERDKPTVKNPTDAVVRITRTCVCGSDLWWYRDGEMAPDSHVGHEGIGVIEEVGDDVTDFKKGDFVIIPFGLSCGTCANCKAGRFTNCTTGSWLSTGQSEYAYVQKANGSLDIIPEGDYTEEQLMSFLTISDVMGTGYHAAVSAAKRVLLRQRNLPKKALASMLFLNVSVPTSLCRQLFSLLVLVQSLAPLVCLTV